MSHLESQMSSIIAYLDGDYHGLSRTAIRKVMTEALSTLEKVRAANEQLRNQLLQEQEARASAEAKCAQLQRDLVGDGDL